MAVTPVGAAGAVGGPDAPGLRVNVAMSQIVFAPVPTLAFGVAPAVGEIWSSVRISMSPTLEMFERTL